jgi:GNAT superfamily N-acetyltransferase
MGDSKNNIRILEGNINDDWDIRNIRYKTWLATYPNVEHNVTVEDVESEFGKYSDIKERRRRLREDHKKGYEDPNWKYYVAKDGDILIGFFIGKKSEKFNRLLAIYVLPEHQGRGVGSRLIRKGLEWFGNDKDIFANLASYNKSAKQFYKKFGFVETGRDATDKHHPLPSGKVIPEIEMLRPRK